MNGDEVQQRGMRGVLALGDAGQRARLWDLPDRRVMMAISASMGVAFILFMTLVFTALGARNGTSRLSVLLLDYPTKHFLYPFTIQNFMHLLFFVGLGELFVRWRVAVREMAFLRERFLPEDEETVLQFADLGAIRRRVARAFDAEHGFLPSLIDLSILQFQASRSVDQAATVMNHALDLIAHRVDLRYGLIRFIAWMVPTVGFIGTVYGLGASLYEAGASADINVQETARTLGVGFDCTMVALMQSAVLVFLMHLAQEKEETSVNLAGSYCLRNLINRLYAERR